MNLTLVDPIRGMTLDPNPIGLGVREGQLCRFFVQL